MIVPMKKITLLALAAEEDRVLSELRSLGVMQIQFCGVLKTASITWEGDIKLPH